MLSLSHSCSVLLVLFGLLICSSSSEKIVSEEKCHFDDDHMCVAAYEYIGCKGQGVWYQEGSQNDLQRDGMLNKVLSVYVRRSCSLRVYEKKNFQGKFSTFGSGYSVMPVSLNQRTGSLSCKCPI